MAHVSYIANGFCMKAKQPGDLFGMCELRFWNPMPQPTTARMTVYYSDKPPVELPPYEIGAEKNPLLVFPGDYPEQFEDCGPWGMKIESGTVLLGDHILSAGRQGPPDNVKYRGGVGDIQLQTRLSKLWYFSDGIRLIWEPANAPFPFDEFEWYHILNPNKADAHVTMKCVLPDDGSREFEHTVPAERLLLFDDFEEFSTTVDFGIEFRSDQPIVVESERIIYGLHGLDEWGAYIHCQRPGVPGPLAES